MDVEPRDLRGRWTTGGNNGRHHKKESAKIEAAAAARAHYGGGTSKADKSLPDGWVIVHDRPRRVVMHDTKTTDPWYKEHGIGFLTWNEEGQISWVQTQDDYLRKGLATHLLNYVRKNIRPDIHHSTELSESGAGFAASDIRRNGGH